MNFLLSSHLPNIILYWLYNLCNCNYPSICGLTKLKGVGLGYTVSLPLLPISLWLFLLSIIVGRSFLLPFQSFASIVALQIIVILVCLWEDVSSGSSYSAILATSSLLLLCSGNSKGLRSLCQGWCWVLSGTFSFSWL